MGCVRTLPCYNGDALTIDRFIKNEIPSGNINSSNLTFATINNFVSDTLEVYLDGSKLIKDFHYTTLGDNQTFTLILNPSDPNALNKAPQCGEVIQVNYIKQSPQIVNCVINL